MIAMHTLDVLASIGRDFTGYLVCGDLNITDFVPATVGKSNFIYFPYMTDFQSFQRARYTTNQMTGRFFSFLMSLIWVVYSIGSYGYGIVFTADMDIFIGTVVQK